MNKTLHPVGLSSGKDSTALWGWMLNDSGIDPAQIVGTFCDTVNEYPEVYEQIRKLDAIGQAKGVRPIKTLNSIGFLALAIKKKRFPSAKARFCTQELKMWPASYFIQELWLDGYEVICYSGVRGDESDERANMPPESFDGFLKCIVRRPLLSWTIQDVWDAHKRYKLPINPLYFQGRQRVGCRLCCMSNKNDIYQTAKRHPEVIDEYREWEKIVGTFKKDGIPSSFFPADKISEHFRSIKNLTRKKTSSGGKKGETYSAGTIDDAVKWSMTLRGGKQTGFEFMFQEDDSHLPCQSGYCE